MHDSAMLFSNLLQDLRGHSKGFITEDLTVQDAQSVSLQNSLLKKLIPKDTAAPDSAALTKFIACNESSRSFSLRPSHLFDDEIIGEVRKYFDNVAFTGPWLNLDLAVIAAGFGLGPGANIGVKSYDFYTKLFDSNLSSTSEVLYRQYLGAISEHPTWLEAEKTRFSHHGVKMVAGSKLSFVPKTFEISRTICTEPVLNMLFQKGIGAFLERRLKADFKIDLALQPDQNKRLARLGSIDGSFGTIDLSNASDSISIELCQQILPDYLFRWLMLTRSPVTTLPSGEQVKLEMISSMGNAFTFPLQTMIFAALVTAVYRLMGIPCKYGNRSPRNFGVFGDDIIVEKSAYYRVIKALELFGFTVNEGKSFNTGSFRESCGGDFYKGHDVRGVYIKDLSHVSSVYSAINRINRWSTRSGVVLPKTIIGLVGSIPPSLRLYVPPSYGDGQGIHAPAWVGRPLNASAGMHAKAALTSRERIREVSRCGLGWSERGTMVVLRTISRAFASDASTFHIRAPIGLGSHFGTECAPGMWTNSKLNICYLDPLPDLRPVPYGIDEQTSLNPDFRYNGAGLLLALLGGYIRNGCISVRKNRFGAKVRRCHTFWYMTDSASLEHRWNGTNFEYCIKIGRPRSASDDIWEDIIDLCLTTVEQVA